jgi:hypothetical protein
MEKQEKMERVIVTRPMMGICHMQVCAVKTATSREILDVCNTQNPSGTRHGWCKVLRRQNKHQQGPIQCETYSDRKHFMIEC